MSPTQRTLAHLRKDLANIPAVVEKWVTIPGHPGGGVRRDLFDCIDILVIQGSKLVAIQATSGTNHKARIDKAKASDKLRAFCGTGNLFEVWSWSKKGPRGKVKRWTPRVTQLVLSDDRAKLVEL